MLTAVASVEHLLRDPPRTGFLTPSQAFGVSFIESIDGIGRCNLRVGATG